ncbi:MAG TPA: hypothetical protein VG222_04555 [Vicinamibacterales bacterium]|nr:hypothetical protein [Vicinamibacterales bacterium]
MALRDRLAQATIGRRDHPDIRSDGPYASESQELAFLQDTQDFRLRSGRHLADFVKKQDPARCQLNLPGLRLLCPRERPALESEQLRFQQLLRQRRAIDRDERATTARRGAVDEPRHDFLPRPRLALQARRGVRRRDLDRLLQDVAPGW